MQRAGSKGARPRAAAAWAGLALLLLLAGCFAPPADDAASPQGPEIGWTPITRTATLDLITPDLPPRETGPVCQTMTTDGAARVLNMTVVIDWTPTSERTQQLRLTLHGPAVQHSTHTGRSPLTATLPTFNVTAGSQFGMTVSLLDDRPTDGFLEPQTVQAHIHFVAERPRDSGDVGRWSGDCI